MFVIKLTRIQGDLIQQKITKTAEAGGPCAEVAAGTGAPRRGTPTLRRRQAVRKLGWRALGAAGRGPGAGSGRPRPAVTCDRWSARRRALGHVCGERGAGVGAAVPRARPGSELVLLLRATARVRRLRGAGRPLPGAPHPPGRGARGRAAGERAGAPEGGRGVSGGRGRRGGAPRGTGRGPGGRSRSPGFAVALAVELGG